MNQQTLVERINVVKELLGFDTGTDVSRGSTPAVLHKSQRGAQQDNYEISDATNLTSVRGKERAVAFINIKEQPHQLCGGYLKSYQLDSLQWLLNIHVLSMKHQQFYEQAFQSKDKSKFNPYDYQVNAILADEMGLGKTIQTIALLVSVKQYFGISGTHLVVVPKSTIPQWQNEFKKWAPFMNLISVIGDYETRGNQLNDVNEKCDICLTSYDVLRIEEKQFLKIPFQYLILDEGHKLKSQETNISEVVRSISVQHMVILTGTPIQNDLKELWSLLNTLNPYIFNNPEEFVEILAQEENVQQLQEILSLFMLRREKKDVEQLPPKHEFLIHCPMTRLQKDIYRGALQKDLASLQGSLSSNNQSLYKNSLVNILMLLRKASDHPYLFRGVEPEPFQEGEHLVNSCGKMIVLDKLLQKIISNHEKVLIFCQMTSMMDIIDDFIRFKKLKYVRIDGSTELHDRAERMQRFMTDPKCNIFLLSTRAGSLGLNLTAANHVIIYQQDFNPQVDHQAVARAYRILQTKNVFVYRLLTENSVDIRIYERAKIKMQLDELIIQNGNFTGQVKELKKQLDFDKKSLFDMITFQTDQLFTNVEDSSKTGKYNYNQPEIMFSDEMLEKVLIEGEQHNAEVEKKAVSAQEQIQNVIQQLTSDGKLESIDVNKLYMFEGEDFGKERMKKLTQQLYKENYKQIEDEEEIIVEVNERRVYPTAQKFKRSAFFKPDFWFLDAQVYTLQNKIFAELKIINDQFQANQNLDYETYLTILQTSQPLIFAGRYHDFALPGLNKEECELFKSFENVYCRHLGNIAITRREFKALVDSLDYEFQEAFGNRVVFKKKVPGRYEHQNPEQFAYFFTQAQLDEYIYVEKRANCDGLSDMDFRESFAQYQLNKDCNQLIEFDQYCSYIQNLLDVVFQQKSMLEDVGKLQQRIEKMKTKRSGLLKKLQVIQALSDHILSLQTVPKFFANQRQGFTPLQDNMMIIGTDLFGYGNWDVILIFLKKMEMFRFDFWFRGREASEIAQRVDVLIRKQQKKQ